MSNENAIGEDFDEFLCEQGILEECQLEAIQRIIAWLSAQAIA